MPAKSKAQFRMMEAAAHGYSDKVKPSVAREFVKKTKSYKALPSRVRKSK